MGMSPAFYSRFKSLVSRVGSDHEGERHVAADKAFQLCSLNHVSFLEAMDGAFGSSSDDDDLRRQIGELEDDNRKLAEAVDVLNSQQHEVPGDAGRQFMQRLWSYAQVRLLLVLSIASYWIWGLPTMRGWTNQFHRGWGHYWNWILVVALCMYGWDWAKAEYSRVGMGITVIKAVVLVGGLTVVLNGPRSEATGNYFFLFLTGLLTITNAANWLGEKLEHSDNEVFTTLRSWFA